MSALKRTMTRTLTVLALLAGVAVPLAIPVPASAQPRLRAEALVSSDLVRFGDLFDGAGADAGLALFRAPDPGLAGTVPAGVAIEAARKAGVPDAVAGDVVAISVIRVSRVVRLAELEAAIAERAASEAGASVDDMKVTFDGDGRDLHMDAGVEGALELARFAADSRSGRFEATFQSGRSLPGSPIRVAGSVVETVEVATLASPVERGETLSEGDMIRERKPRSQAAGLLDIRDAVGLAARRSLREGQSLRQGDLMRPQYVERGGFITLIYAGAGVSLTLKAKALGNGASGDLVAVQNLQSKRVVNGVVTGPSQVTVTAAATAVARR